MCNMSLPPTNCDNIVPTLGPQDIEPCDTAALKVSPDLPGALDGILDGLCPFIAPLDECHIARHVITPLARPSPPRSTMVHPGKRRGRCQPGTHRRYCGMGPGPGQDRCPGSLLSSPCATTDRNGGHRVMNAARDAARAPSGGAQARGHDHAQDHEYRAIF